MRSVPKIPDLPSFFRAGVVFRQPLHGILQSSPHSIEQRAPIRVPSFWSSPRIQISEWRLVRRSGVL